MKQKIKLWILQIEGWKKSAVYKDTKSIFKPKLLPVHKYGYQSIEKAWNNQFPNFKTILQTKLFWLIFSTVLGALFFFFDDNSTVIKNGISWFSTAGALCFLFPLGWTLYAIGYMICRWIKNLLNRKK